MTANAYLLMCLQRFQTEFWKEFRQRSTDVEVRMVCKDKRMEIMNSGGVISIYFECLFLYHDFHFLLFPISFFLSFLPFAYPKKKYLRYVCIKMNKNSYLPTAVGINFQKSTSICHILIYLSYFHLGISNKNLGHPSRLSFLSQMVLTFLKLLKKRIKDEIILNFFFFGSSLNYNPQKPWKLFFNSSCAYFKYVSECCKSLPQVRVFLEFTYL